MDPPGLTIKDARGGGGNGPAVECIPNEKRGREGVGEGVNRIVVSIFSREI